MYIYTYMSLGYTASLFSEAFCMVVSESSFWAQYQNLKKKSLGKSYGDPFGYHYTTICNGYVVISATKPVFKTLSHSVMTSLPFFPFVRKSAVCQGCLLALYRGYVLGVIYRPSILGWYHPSKLVCA